jgi:hypothetical protein
MGLFSKITKVFTPLEKVFRTGATQAAKDATAAGEATLLEQGQLKQEIGDIYSPRMQAGNQAFQDVAGYYAGDQQAIIDQAQASPFMSSLVSAGESAVARNQQATGGFRSGTTQENLAQNSQNVLMGLVDQILQGKQGVAQAGFGAEDAYTTAMQNIIAGQGATRGEIANIGIGQAANKQQMIGSLVNAGTQAAATAFSDKRLKQNIVKVGEKNNLNWYSWDWNDLAKGVGLTGSDEGHIAQEVQSTRPELVVEKDGYLAVNYGGF